jgi:hypothetical protein
MQAIAAESFTRHFKDKDILVLLVGTEISGLFPACWIQNFTSKIRILPEAYPALAKRLDPTPGPVQRDRKCNYKMVDLA